jgi:hypothetical protein
MSTKCHKAVLDRVKLSDFLDLANDGLSWHTTSEGAKYWCICRNPESGLIGPRTRIRMYLDRVDHDF